MALSFIHDKQQRRSLLIQILRFGVVGISNTLVGYGLYSFFLTLFRMIGVLEGFDYLVAQTLEFILGVLWTFYWNNRLVFSGRRTKEELIAALLKSYAMYISTGLILSGMLLVLWIEILGISAYVAPLLNLIVTVPLNFIISKFWVYKSREELEKKTMG